MNFEQLKSFSSVAVTRSFSQAAKERFLSQPTVSNQVKALENELGVQLLDRTASQVQIYGKWRKIFNIYTADIGIGKQS